MKKKKNNKIGKESMAKLLMSIKYRVAIAVEKEMDKLAKELGII